jgi:hypothetical protein
VIDLTHAIWRKSTRSGNGGDCVEVASNLLNTHGVIAVRDSKDPNSPALTFTRSEWEAFTGGVHDGEFDL